MAIKLSDHFTYKKLFKFVLPSIVMMIFTSLYGVVDGYFVSNMAGKTAFAALNFVFPFIMILGGTGFMIGTGGSALVAKILGEGDNERANKVFTQMIYFTLIAGVILTAIGLIFVKPVARALGAGEEMLDDCVLYGSIVIAFTTTFMLQNLFQSFLVTAEKPKLGLYITIAAGVTNMILDAVFIALFKWGLAGAAVATGIGQTVGGVIPLIYFLRKNDSLLRITKTKLEAKPILAACSNGSSEFMSNIASSLVGLLYNYQLLRLFGKNGVSAYGVLMYVQFVFIAISIGYTIGSAAIVSYNYGAGNKAELKNIFGKSVVVMSVSGVVLAGLAQALASPFAKIFVGYDEELLNLTVKAFRLFSFSFLLSGFNIFSSGFFTALNNGVVSAIISFLRTLVFQAASVIVLPIIIGKDGIWLAITVAEVCAFALSLSFLIAKHKKYGYY